MRDSKDIEIERLQKENLALNQQLRTLILSDVKRVQIQEELDKARTLYAKLVERIHLFSSTTEKADLFKAVADFIIYEIEVQRCVILYHNDNDIYSVRYSEGYYNRESQDKITALTFQKNSAITHFLLSKKADTILPDVTVLSPLKDRLQMAPIGMVPIFEEGQCTGFIFLGTSETEKEFYTMLDQSTEQVNILKLLSMNLSATLENMNNLNKLVDAKKRIETLALHDPLTGLYNRRGLQNQIDKEMERFERRISNKKVRKDSKSIGIILGDIDHFKQVNDNYGHHVGDAILELVSLKLKSSIRKQDSIGRWGGEEFFLMLPKTDVEGAITLAEKLRQNIENLEYHLDKKKLKVTMSFGVSAFGPESDHIKSIDAAIRCADKNLYDAKNSGRNRVLPKNMQSYSK